MPRSYNNPSWDEPLPDDLETLAQRVGELRAGLQTRDDDTQGLKDTFHGPLDQYRSLFKHALDGILIADDDGRYVEANPAICELLGYSREELLSLGVDDITFGLQKDQVATLWRQFIDAGQLTGEYQLLTKDGNRLDMEYLAVANYVPGRHLSVIRDIRDRKQAERRVEENRELLRSVTDFARDAIVMLDSRHKVSFWNPAAEELFGTKESDALGRDFATEFFPQSGRDRLIETLNDSKEERPSTFSGEFLEVPAFSSGGRDRLVEMSLRKFDFNAEERLLAVIRDITDRRQLELELAKSERLESIGVLAGGIAHDFNNILVAILGNISLAKLDMPENSELRQILLEAETAAERAKDLTHQLLTFSRGGAPIRRACELGDVIADSVRFASRGTSALPEIEIDTDLKAAYVDEGQISQVIYNLVINSVHAMPNGGRIGVRARNLRVSSESNLPLTSGDYVQLEVSDEGEGIPSKHLPHVFDPFYSTKMGGTGLGLASSYSIMKRHNGHIHLDSAEGEGTRVYLYLPSSDTVGATITGKESDRIESGSGSVLVVDDEHSILSLLKTVLSRLGYDAILATNLREAVEKARDRYDQGDTIEIALLDMTIPGGPGGQDIANALWAIDPEIRAVMSTGYSNEFSLESIRDMGFSDCLPKPYKASQVAEVLYRVMSS